MASSPDHNHTLNGDSNTQQWPPPPAIIGLGASNSTPRVGFFRHSNPKLGEQLLYFMLSSLRGPIQSAKTTLATTDTSCESVVTSGQHDLTPQHPPRDASPAGLLSIAEETLAEFLSKATGTAVEWVQLPGMKPGPDSIGIVAISHGCTGVAARACGLVGLEPTRVSEILKDRPSWFRNCRSVDVLNVLSTGNGGTIELLYMQLYAPTTLAPARDFWLLRYTSVLEDGSLVAYLQQELEKLHDLRNKVKLEGEHWDDLVSSSSQNSHLVSKATRLWESILARKSQHEVLASGPIEDLIAHWEHRYRISGSSLLAAMDQSSQVPYADVLSVQSGDFTPTHVDDKEQSDGSYVNINREKMKNTLDSSHSQVNDETLHRADERSGRVHPTVDVAEIIRHWTHALQRIHKQSLHMAKANEGEGPEILRSAHEGSSSGHAESLAATLAEHQQHLVSFQVLINQLKEVAPAIQKSISECTDKVDSISSNLPPMTKHPGQMEKGLASLLRSAC